MPEMSGMDLSRELKSRDINIPAILLSSAVTEDKKACAMLFCAVLAKPVKPLPLLLAIKEALTPKVQDTIDIHNPISRSKVIPKELADEYPLTILLAEDNLINQKLAIKVLNRLGYKPDVANNGLEVLDMVKQRNYNLILMDVLMPEMDGLEATRIIRATDTHQPHIVAMTANAFPEDREACFRAGMNGYLSKPIQMDEFVKTLKVAVESFKF
jgi:CheY-like chemotaxis protein